jgi:hypothetical protein
MIQELVFANRKKIVRAKIKRYLETSAIEHLVRAQQKRPENHQGFAILTLLYLMNLKGFGGAFLSLSGMPILPSR